MNRFATLLTGAALFAAQTVFAQMGAPDAKPEPGFPGVAGASGGKVQGRCRQNYEGRGER